MAQKKARLRRVAGVVSAFLFLGLAPAAFGTTCSFDDQSPLPANTLGEIPATYCGASWSAPNGNTPLYFTGSYSVVYGSLSAHSQPNALYLPFGGAEFIGMSFPAPVAFNGFWASNPTPLTCNNHPCTTQLQITLTLGGNLVDSVSVALPAQGYTFISSGYSGQVDGVSINATQDILGSGGIAIDDISYNGSCTASIQPNAQVNYPTTGGTGTVMVTATAGCPWTAASAYSWITVTSGASGTGTGAPQTITYSVAANTQSGFRLGSLTIAGLSLPIQEAGVAQFQAQGTLADGTMGTANVIGRQPVTFSGSGWQADGGPITVAGGNVNQTFSPPSFSGSVPNLVFTSSTPPCSAQITATQGSITKTVMLTGIYLGKVVLPGETGIDAGQQICQTAQYSTAQQFLFSESSLVTSQPFAVESALTNYGGSLFYVLNPRASVQWIGGVLVNPGATVTFPDWTGHTMVLQGDATAPIASGLLAPAPQVQSIQVPGPTVDVPLAGIEQVTGNLIQPGGVSLNNGFLYINGNATVTGGLVGNGYFFATGAVDISGSVNLLSPNIAFAAGGNITFTGAAANPPTLANVPGALKQIAVGADGSTWGVNAQQQIYQYHSDPGWTNIPGALAQIAVGSSTAIWGLNAQEQIYRWDSVHSDWVNVPGSLAQIAVSGDGDVWGINYQSNIYHYNSDTGLFSQVPGTFSEIAVGAAGAVYGVNAGGGIFWYNPGTSYFEWIANTIGFTQLAVGQDGDLWAVKNNIAYHYDVLHNTMRAAAGASIARVAVGSGASVLGVAPGGQVFQWNAGSQTWAPVPGNLSSIAVGANGAVWGVNASQQIFTTGQVTRGYQTLSWIPGSLSQISVGADGSTWALNGNTVEFFNTGTQSFQPVSGAPALAQLSVGAGADVWGLDSGGNTFHYDASAAAWNNIPGNLKFIRAAAGGSVWGINADGETYTYDASSQGWTNIPGSLAQLSVGADGTVWGINAQQQIYRFDGAQWVNVPGSLTQISVGNANSIWGINAAQQVYYTTVRNESGCRFRALTWRRSRWEATGRCGASTAREACISGTQLRKASALLAAE